MEHGKAGLWYLTDPKFPGMFIAAVTPEEAVTVSVQAALALQGMDQPIDRHTLHEHATGALVTVPDPDWMTPDQRAETIKRLQRHLLERIVS